MSEIFPVVVVVVFWLVAFVLAIVFSARALRAPIEYEEEHATEVHDANPHTQTAQ